MNNLNSLGLYQLFKELDEVYHIAPLIEYEITLQAAVMQVQQVFPGWTIAYAEISTAGSQRESHGGMHHVLLPLQAPDSVPDLDVKSMSGNHPARCSCFPTRGERPAGLPLAGRQDKAPPDTPTPRTQTRTIQPQESGQTWAQ